MTAQQGVRETPTAGHNKAVMEVGTMVEFGSDFLAAYLVFKTFVQQVSLSKQQVAEFVVKMFGQVTTFVILRLVAQA